MKTLRFILTGIATTGSLTLPIAVLAQGSPFERAQSDLSAVGGAAGVGQQQELPVLVGRIINIVLGFIGILLIAYFVYAGFLWMTAGGNEDQVTKAKTIIKNAIIGLIVTVAAFAITNFVLGSIINAAGT
jgi:phage shock protein PspC (stress-responsive transcriptional regulator)